MTTTDTNDVLATLERLMKEADEADAVFNNTVFGTDERYRLMAEKWRAQADYADALRQRAEALERENAELRDGFKASQDAVFALTRDLTAAEAERDRLRVALEWYGQQVAACRFIHNEGDMARRALDQDGGKRARAALKEATNG